MAALIDYISDWLSVSVCTSCPWQVAQTGRVSLSVCMRGDERMKPSFKSGFCVCVCYKFFTLDVYVMGVQRRLLASILDIQLVGLYCWLRLTSAVLYKNSWVKRFNLIYVYATRAGSDSDEKTSRREKRKKSLCAVLCCVTQVCCFDLDWSCTEYRRVLMKKDGSTVVTDLT